MVSRGDCSGLQLETSKIRALGRHDCNTAHDAKKKKELLEHKTEGSKKQYLGNLNPQVPIFKPRCLVCWPARVRQNKAQRTEKAGRDVGHGCHPHPSFPFFLSYQKPSEACVLSKKPAWASAWKDKCLPPLSLSLIVEAYTGRREGRAMKNAHTYSGKPSSPAA